MDRFYNCGFPSFIVSNNDVQPGVQSEREHAFEALVVFDIDFLYMHTIPSAMGALPYCCVGRYGRIKFSILIIASPNFYLYGFQMYPLSGLAFR